MTGVSMYRLISISLVGLLLLSALFAAVGLIGYSPVGIAVTAVLAVSATLLATVMAAQTMKSIAHLESSIITGLLITFIVPPTLDTRDLLGVSVAGLIAGFSKYFLVYRSRHVLNPAATGVTIAGLLGLTAGFWWIANPPMTAFILVSGLIIAWRSGTLPVALTGLGIGVGAVMIRLVGSGEPLWGSAYLVLTSYPILFLALFMLTEPLTLPARRWAQLVVAAIVGIAVALPWSLSLGGVGVSSSPELALVIGNLVALGLVVGTRTTRSTNVSLTSSTTFGDRGLLLQFSLARPVSLQAGQWVELHLPHRKGDRRGQRRIFSIASAPGDATGTHPTLSIATTLATPGSSFKQSLANAPVGSAARITTVGGDFLLPTDPHTPLLFVAGGIGITPFISHLADLAKRQEHRDCVLIEVRSHQMAQPWDDLIRNSAITHIVLERAQLEETLARDDLGLSHRVGFVSGSPAFVKDLTSSLRKLGVRRVHTDSFIGY